MIDGVGPKVLVTIEATMQVSVYPYNEYSNYIGESGFPDIPDEEVEKINPVELAIRIVKFENEHGVQSLGAAFNEDWDVDSIEGNVVGE